ncbi:MAG: Nuclear pore complex protein Nup98-Nup96 [Pycnora praestabilis]|nr:MAG: Nuclear pore complex protein Nup98-Nup96 [Pycnora praestabilis]
MSAFGFGSNAGGFGSSNNNNNNQQQNTGFGGFGQSANTNSTGFGSGGNTTGGGLFGSTSTGFGSGNTGFGTSGTQQSSPFGAAKPFGATNTTSSGGGLFGNNTATAGSSTGFGGGGFGTTNNTTNNSSPFGGGNTGGGLFGTNKPAFGAAASNPSGGLFGSSASTGFGAANNAPATTTTTTGAFGGAVGTALSNGPTPQSDGTGGTPFQAFTEKDVGSQVNHFQSISFMQPYQKFSFEELRAADYAQGRRYGNGNGQAGAFGTNTGFGSFGNTNTGSGFGSTGNTGNNLFGSTSGNNSSPFGGAQTASTGFGTSGGGGLFGAAQQPAAGGGLFGTTPASTSQPSGGLFGTTGNTGFGGGTTTGFGGGNTGGGLFGGAKPENKPQGFQFGGGSGTTGGFGSASTGGFGQNNTSTSGGLFGGGNSGAASTAPAFGGGQQQQGNSNPFGGFGQNQQTQNQSTSSSGFGGFGSTSNNQPKTGGLFGTTGTGTTVGGLFGGASNTQQQQQPTGGLFGGAGNNAQTGGGLFGGNKPANTGTTGGLFGNPGTNTNSTGGGLFGGSQNQQNQGGGLFGGTQQAQNSGGLFGGSTNNTTSNSGGLFGGLGGSTNNQQSGGSSLFGGNMGNSQNQQQQPGGLFGGSNVLGNSQLNQQQGQQQQQPFMTSIAAPNPYGNDQLFANLATPGSQSVGPIATPLSSSQKLKKSAILPQYKINPSASSRLVTPQKRGYGFSYSTYGTPGSASSNVSTPGALSSGLLSSSYGRSFGRGLGKSLSTSNLRRTFDSEDSVLSPGAFSASNTRYSNMGSLKKLTIDRNIRTDLFGGNGNAPALPSPERIDPSKQPGILKKKVSFDASTVGGSANGGGGLFARSNGNVSGSSSRNGTNSTTSSAEGQSSSGSSSRVDGSTNPGPASRNSGSGIAPPPEMEQVKGNELAIVHEDDSSAPSEPSNSQTNARKSHDDQKAGQYYMVPSKEEIRSMPRQQLKSFSGFIAGREGCGQITFDRPVNLASVDLDNLFGKIIDIGIRSATVYPDNTNKPPMGQGLNVPSTITLENSWPRGKDKRAPSYEKSGPRFNKHVDRLRKVTGTEFISYDKDTGVWIFKVEHFTTYGMEYDDETTDGESFAQSTLTTLPDTPTPKSRTHKGYYSQLSDRSQQNSSVLSEAASEGESDPEDTFEFKKKKILPGAFDEEAVYEEHEYMSDEQQSPESDGQSFLDERSVASPSQNGIEERREVQDDSVDMEEDESVEIENENQEMAGSYPNSDLTTERQGGAQPLLGSFAAGPKSILKASQQQQRQFISETPAKTKLMLRDSWTEQLQRTISPKKQDRQALRVIQGTALQERELGRDATPKGKTTGIGEQPFTTSIDLMNSLFGQDSKKSVRGSKEGIRAKGFEWPYAKKSKTYDADETSMDPMEKAFHDSYKPSWGPNGTLLYAQPTTLSLKSNNTSTRGDALLTKQNASFVSADKEVRFANLVDSDDLTPDTLGKQKKESRIRLIKEVPHAILYPESTFQSFSALVEDDDPHSSHEKLVWELAGILFDDVGEDIPSNIDASQADYVESRVRKDRLSNFWRRLVGNDAALQAAKMATPEEKAIAYLSGHHIEDACGALLDGKDFRLATLIAMVGGDVLTRRDMEDQIEQWRRLNVLSEMTEPIRALYELLAGNSCICEGKKGPTEDRARSFVISERFSLDWRRAFGLRLWYSILEEEPIGAAVQSFADDLKEDIERSRPVPWFVEQKAEMAWKDEQKQEREDLLWGILKVFADKAAGVSSTRLEDVLLPQNAKGDPINARLSFQLYHALLAHRVADFDDASTEPGNGDVIADKITWDYATQLENASEFMWAMFVVLHLSNAPQRMRAIQQILARHADVLGGPDSKPFRALVDELLIPEAWIWEAKALFARAVEFDSVGEVYCLLKANNWEEAHKTLCRRVGPQAVIEQNFDTLSELLSGFKDVNLVFDWNTGGQIFMDYMRLLDFEQGHGKVMPERDQKGLPKENGKREVVRRLLVALPAMSQEKAQDFTFVEKVAMQEMSGVVGKAILEGKKNAADAAKVLQLPLTEDAYLRHTMDLSLGYYRSVIAGGR